MGEENKYYLVQIAHIITVASKLGIVNAWFWVDHNN